MAKSIVLGNGNMLIGLDYAGQVREFYYPYVGLENQIAFTQVHKIGVWCDGEFHWLDDGTWTTKTTSLGETMASNITATHQKLQLEINFNDVVYNEKNIFLRRITVTNLGDYQRTIKLYFNQQFEIYESFRGDTAFFDPIHHVMIHYKGRRVFLINTLYEGKSFDDYAAGLIKLEGKEGTYKDAEDGELSKNPIEHGLVDSVIGIEMQINGHENKSAYYWMAAAKYYQEVQELNNYVIHKTPAYLFESTTDFWHAWINKEELNLGNLDKDIVDLFKHSLIYIRAHIDNNGSIIASGDADLLKQGRGTYSYMWHRDAAFAAIALDKAGYSDLTKKFFECSNEVIMEEGYFMHKYRADKSLGSSWHAWTRNGKAILPIQEDETAMVIYALWKHYEVDKDLEFIEVIYNSLIKKAAEFMIMHLDEGLNLPKPSFDLWEEKYGIHTFTASAVYGALMAAANFAEVLGKEERHNRYIEFASQIRQSILQKMHDKDNNYFYKLLDVRDHEVVPESTIDISSFYGIFKFGILDIDDPLLATIAKTAEDSLTVRTAVGGLARYAGDYYFRVSHEVPGNPWIITSLWLAQYYIAKAKTVGDLSKAHDWLKWAVKYATPSGVLSEQLDPYSGQQLSASPLVWSHAEFVTTVLEYQEKLSALNKPA